jgi:Bacteriocin-protection, YdeI or OmpD-Associated/Domain of unknown function (DUF1905)
MRASSKGSVASSPSHRFQATIYKIWMLRYVDVPEKVGRALERESGKKKYIPVLTVANGRRSRTTLTPAGQGRYRLPVSVKLCKAARAEVGDLMGIELRVDHKSRALPIPEEIRQALKSRPQARKAFEQMGPGTRRQLLLWFAASRSAAVRQARLARLMDLLTERALLGRR